VSRARLLPLLSLLALVGGDASAQMPDPRGIPLPDPQLDAGTVTVRVVRGAMTAPVAGMGVTLAPDNEAGDQRTARTGTDGRAVFKDLPAGSHWVASVTVDETDLQSQAFEVPGQGGVKLVLSPTPVQMPGAGPAPSGGGQTPPMAPHDMRSRARGDRGMPPGSLQVLVVRGAWDKPVGIHPIHLIGLTGSAEILHQTELTGSDGRVIFDNLRPDVAWYPLAVLARGDIDDRLAGLPVSMPPRVGMKLVLSGLAIDSTDPASDDFNDFFMDQGAAPGLLTVRIGADADDLAKVDKIEVFDALTDQVVATPPAVPAERIVDTEWQPPRADDRLQDRRIVVGVMRGDGRQAMPVQGVTIELAPEQGEPIVRETDDRGAAIFDGLEAGAKYTPRLVMFDRRFPGEQVTVPEKAGMVSVVTAAWEGPVKTASVQGLPGGNDHVYVVRAQVGTRTHLSPPFQLTRSNGAVVPLEISPPPEFRFHVTGQIDDQRMVFQAQLDMSNGIAAPYTPDGGNLFIPLPAGFSAAAVEDQWSERVRVEPGRGLVWKGAVPPGGFSFNASFAMPIEDGGFTFDLDLPSGASNSNIVLEHRPEMKVETLGESHGGVRTLQGRRYYVITDINVDPQQALVMRVSGLPQPPRWRTWVRNGVGVLVIVLLAMGITGVVARNGRARVVVKSERERLLDQLVDLERRFRDGGVPEAKYRKQRGRLTQRLEVLYGGEAPGRDDRAPGA